MLFKIVLDGVQHITKSTWSSISCRLTRLGLSYILQRKLPW